MKAATTNVGVPHRLNPALRPRRLITLLAASLACTAAHASGTAATLSSSAVAVSTDWHRYVRTPTQQTLRPVRVLGISGDVTNAEALLDPRAGSTVITWKRGRPQPVILLDYGQEIAGLPQLEVSAYSGTPELQVAFSETTYLMTPTGDGSSTASQGNSGSALTYFTAAVSATGTVAPSQTQGGFRYQRVTLSKPGSVTLSGVGVEFSPPRLAAEQYAGYFLSDDDILNRAWFDSAYTLNLGLIPAGTPGNNGRPYDVPVAVEGAKRDRALWIGDLLIMGPSLQLAFGSLGAAHLKGSLDVFAAHPATSAVLYAEANGSVDSIGPMAGVCQGLTTGGCAFYSASYSFNYVMALHDYWQESGDLNAVRQAWPLVQRELAWEQTLVDARTGLVRIPAAASADWSVGVHPGISTAANVQHYASLDDGARMASALGDTASATLYRHRADATRDAINRQLWNERMGAYDATTTNRNFVVQDANSWAVYYGVATPAQSARILSTMNARLSTQYGLRYAEAGSVGYKQQIAPKVSPFISGFTLLSAYQSNRADLALDLLHKTWGWMQQNEPASTVWERIGLPDGKMGQVSIFLKDPSESAAHGWATGPIAALARHVAGISPLTAGYASWQVRPQTHGLHWAQARVPAAAGPISSRWELGTANNSFKLTVESSGGTQGSVSVPLLGAQRQIYRDGTLVWTGDAAANGATAVLDGDYVRFSCITGTHTWAWSSAP